MTLQGRPAPVLVGCSHGTDSPAGRAAIRALLDDVRAARPDLDVREAFVDVQEPAVGDVVDAAVLPRPRGEGRDAVVVPLLLSAGFHVHVDVTEAVAGRGPDAGRAARTGALGPDPRLVDVLVDRLADAALAGGDAVVLAAAGSSDARSAQAVEEVLAGLRARVPAPVTVGYGSMARPSVGEAVAAARASGAARVVVAAYLLAPGFFLDRLREAGADVVTAPLAPDPRLTAVVLDRYAAGAAEIAGTSPAPASAAQHPLRPAE
ncbi:sirohydrochlorin chelatase [Cellulomonas sp. PhB143]|uniref:sirohydrochlorin chelatase n=1 Tax=Cellulomonas sp. PhB143 TaxID=2485186 RepID=UPI000F467E2C|nr:CbiX/SirB N-terminal domain-containing protein [Cellulomonas sp. PhB143]ROS79066.1 sirohydrochlorin ferrochelatase [Cellulomonas sp. PhB143]